MEIKEEWTDIKGYEGKYKLSNTGKVVSLNYNNTSKPKELKIKVNRYGYNEVTLSKNNIKKDYMVARLVAQHFIPNPKNCPLVTHISNNKQDDCYTNLKWAYLSETRFLMYKKGSRKVGKPTKNIISYKGRAYKSYTELAEANNIRPRILYKRLHKGWSLEEALEIPEYAVRAGTKPYLYKYYDKYLTLEEIAKINNIPKRLIAKRLYKGWNIYEAAEIKNGGIK